jgi:hypothetical protein
MNAKFHELTTLFGNVRPGDLRKAGPICGGSLERIRKVSHGGHGGHGGKERVPCCGYGQFFRAEDWAGKIKDGTEYEDEFEYEYDWGTIARFESLLGRAMSTSPIDCSETDSSPAQKRSLRSPSTLLAPSRSPIVLELGFFSVG